MRFALAVFLGLAASAAETLASAAETLAGDSVPVSKGCPPDVG